MLVVIVFFMPAACMQVVFRCSLLIYASVIFVNENENENAKTAKLVTMRRLRVLRPYSVESVTNGGRYLGRSSTHLRQQV